jgi:hypothetical protein
MSFAFFQQGPYFGGSARHERNAPTVYYRNTHRNKDFLPPGQIRGVKTLPRCNSGIALPKKYIGAGAARGGQNEGGILPLLVAQIAAAGLYQPGSQELTLR